MPRTIVWFVYFWLYQIALLPTLIKVTRLARSGRIKERDSIVNKVVPNWARSLVNLTGSSIVVKGEENIPKDKPVLFVSNHQGNFDIPIFLGFINKPKAFIAKKELQKIPFISSWMKHMQCVFIDRSDIRQSLRQINEAAENLKQGYSMVIFPEGTRSKGDAMSEFKPGSLKLALKAQVPIIPVTIRGSYKIMEQHGFIMKPAQVEIIISKPVATGELAREEITNLPSKIQNIIASNL